MLGLSSGLVFNNYPIEIIPTDISDLVGWWDFTDASSMYTDAGSTNVSSNGDLVERIDNKAYTNNNSSVMLGRFMARKTTSGDDYANKYVTGGSNGKSYISFALRGGLVTAPADAYGGIDISGSGDYRVSTSTVSSDSCTYFTVGGQGANPIGLPNDTGPRNILFNIQGSQMVGGFPNTITATGMAINNGGSQPNCWNPVWGSGTFLHPMTGNISDGFTNGLINDSGSGAQILTVQGAGNGSSIVRKNGVGGTTTGDSDSVSDVAFQYDFDSTAGGISNPLWSFMKVSIGNEYTHTLVSNTWAEEAQGWGTTVDLADDQTHSIYEVIFYNRKLSLNEMVAVEKYLKTKYGIS
tara:strand:- start:1742 stop:2797 length:1056 start_codon:yes stop_codon:yes gene_type:complete